MKIFTLLVLSITLAASAALATTSPKAEEASYVSATSDTKSKTTEIVIVGAAAKEIYEKMTEPSRTDSYDADKGVEVFIKIGLNISCTYATTNPEAHNCSISLNSPNGQALQKH